MKVKHIAAFWGPCGEKNWDYSGKPNFGLQFFFVEKGDSRGKDPNTFEVNNLTAFENYLHDALPDWKPAKNESKADFAKFLISQLYDFASFISTNKLNKMTAAEYKEMFGIAAALAVNIYWLEENGFLKPDDVNGMQFMYQETITDIKDIWKR